MFFGGEPTATDMSVPVGHRCASGDEIGEGDVGLLLPELVYDPDAVAEWVLTVEGPEEGDTPAYYAVWHRDCFLEDGQPAQPEPVC